MSDKMFVDILELKITEKWPGDKDDCFFVELTNESLNRYIFGELTRLQNEYAKGLMILNGGQ